MSAGPEDSHENGVIGLKRMDEVLAKRPHKDGVLLSEATRALTRYRKGLIARYREGRPEDRYRLERLNAVLSVTAGLHFPLGEPPWDEFSKARTWLQELLDEDARSETASAG